MLEVAALVVGEATGAAMAARVIGMLASPPRAGADMGSLGV